MHGYYAKHKRRAAPQQMHPGLTRPPKDTSARLGRQSATPAQEQLERDTFAETSTMVQDFFTTWAMHAAIPRKVRRALLFNPVLLPGEVRATMTHEARIRTLPSDHPRMSSVAMYDGVFATLKEQTLGSLLLGYYIDALVSAERDALRRIWGRWDGSPWPGFDTVADPVRLDDGLQPVAGPTAARARCLRRHGARPTRRLPRVSAARSPRAAVA